MSSYIESADTEDEEEQQGITEELKAEVLAQCSTLKSVGNDHFSKKEYEAALTKYSEALKLLKSNRLPRDSLILLNRSATYLALQRYVPALYDANQAIEVDSTNWKGHWRKGVALMSMAKKQFRTKEAIESFENCLKCGTLPDNKISDIQNELAKARRRLDQQIAETPTPDLSACAPS